MRIEQITEWFWDWTRLKVNIHLQNNIPYFRTKEIWWASLGANIGFEQNGKNSNYERPILVLKKFNKDMLWILPLTSRNKKGPFYFDLSSFGFQSRVIISQLRLISSKRLIRKLGIVPVMPFRQIKEMVRTHLQ